jgi:hypothetical protein
MNAKTPAASTTTAPTVPVRKHLDEFFARVDPIKGRLIFGMDATASRQPTWDVAAKLTSQMFSAVAGNNLLMQLVYYSGIDRCSASRWLSDARSLTTIMTGVTCRSGETQIERLLAHTRKENARQKVDALVVVSDACEEDPAVLFAAARALATVPVFMFQEGKNEHVASIYAKIADITKGAYGKFDTGSAQRLADLLKAVAAFAAGGVKALADQNSEAAKLLLIQIKR